MFICKVLTIVFSATAFISMILAIFLLFKWKVWKIIGLLSGLTEKRALKMIRNQKEHRVNNSYLIHQHKKNMMMSNPSLPNITEKLVPNSNTNKETEEKVKQEDLLLPSNQNVGKQDKIIKQGPDNRDQKDWYDNQEYMEAENEEELYKHIEEVMLNRTVLLSLDSMDNTVVLTMDDKMKVDSSEELFFQIEEDIELVHSDEEIE